MSKWVMLGLLLLAISLQVELWLSDDGFQKTRDLRAAVAEQSVLNDELQERNSALDAEVLNLRRGLEAAEERARTDLGMIGPNETYFQVVSAKDSNLE